MPSKPPTAPMRRSILLCSGIGALALSACASPTPPPLLMVPVARSLREPCPRPAPEAVVTAGDLAAFSLRQEAALSICEARRAALVSVADAHNAAVRDRRR